MSPPKPQSLIPLSLSLSLAVAVCVVSLSPLQYIFLNQFGGAVHLLFLYTNTNNKNSIHLPPLIQHTIFLSEMKTITARSPHESFSFSRRYLNWKKKSTDDEEEDDMAEILNLDASNKPPPRKKPSVMRWARALGRAGPRLLVGTLFGHRRGHVCLAFQEEFKLGPGFLVELATPTSALVKEMASGLVRIALECEKRAENKGSKLLEEPVWRAYCNGKKCGYAMRRECGPDEWEVLNAIGPISMGAGVLPCGGPDPHGEMMYMRAKFERVVGSKDSEAFYMMNPDGNGGPELSIYLLRV